MYFIFIKLTTCWKFDFYRSKYSTLKFEIKQGMLSYEKVNILNIIIINNRKIVFNIYHFLLSDVVH